MSKPIPEDPDQNPTDEDCWDAGCDGYACEHCPFMPDAIDEEDHPFPSSKTKEVEN